MAENRRADAHWPASCSDETREASMVDARRLLSLAARKAGIEADGRDLTPEERMRLWDALLALGPAELAGTGLRTAVPGSGQSVLSASQAPTLDRLD